VNEGREVGIERWRVSMMPGDGPGEQALGRVCLEDSRQEIRETRAEEPHSVVKGAEQQRKEGLVSVAVGEDEASYPLSVPGDNQLADGPARVVADQRNVAQVQSLQQKCDHTSHPQWAQIRVFSQRYRMTPEGKIRHHTKKPLRERWHKRLARARR
jgi:hypothetical protein